VCPRFILNKQVSVQTRHSGGGRFVDQPQLTRFCVIYLVPLPCEKGFHDLVHVLYIYYPTHTLSVIVLRYLLLSLLNADPRWSLRWCLLDRHVFKYLPTAFWERCGLPCQRTKDAWLKEVWTRNGGS
jgi:hypothetical protein